MPSNRFWRLRSPKSTRKLAEWAVGQVETEKVLCALDPGHRRSGKRLSDLSVTLPQGTVQDFAWTWYGECIVQDRVLDLFRGEGFTGFDVKAVNARFQSGQGEPPKLWELVRFGWGGLARPDTGIVRVRYCEGCKSVRYSGIHDPRKLVDASQWDGSDFFMVWPLPNFVFVTQRVADFIRGRRLTGVFLERSDDYEPNPAVIEGFSPGRLSYWMPEAHATS